jgi:hypothetical protein
MPFSVVDDDGAGLSVTSRYDDVFSKDGDKFKI